MLYFFYWSMSYIALFPASLILFLLCKPSMQLLLVSKSLFLFNTIISYYLDLSILFFVIMTMLYTYSYVLLRKAFTNRLIEFPLQMTFTVLLCKIIAFICNIDSLKNQI